MYLMVHFSVLQDKFDAFLKQGYKSWMLFHLDFGTEEETEREVPPQAAAYTAHN